MASELDAADLLSSLQKKITTLEDERDTAREEARKLRSDNESQIRETKAFEAAWYNASDEVKQLRHDMNQLGQKCRSYYYRDSEQSTTINKLQRENTEMRAQLEKVDELRCCLTKIPKGIWSEFRDLVTGEASD